MKFGKEIWDDSETRDEYVSTMLWDPELFSEKFYHLEYDDLPEWIRLGMEVHPKKGVKITEKIVVEGIIRIQLMEVEGFKEGDRVKVIIEKIEPVEVRE